MRVQRHDAWRPLRTTSSPLPVRSPFRTRTSVSSLLPLPRVAEWMSVAKKQTEARTRGSNAACTFRDQSMFVADFVRPSHMGHTLKACEGKYMSVNVRLLCSEGIYAPSARRDTCRWLYAVVRMVAFARQAVIMQTCDKIGRAHV